MTSKFIYKVIRIKAGFVARIIHPNCLKTGKQIHLRYLMDNGLRTFAMFAVIFVTGSIFSGIDHRS